MYLLLINNILFLYLDTSIYLQRANYVFIAKHVTEKYIPLIRDLI